MDLKPQFHDRPARQRRPRVAPWLAALALGWLGCAETPPEIDRVLLVSIDTLRADYVGAYGAREAATPTLDRLAAEGVLFENAMSPAPLTLPSHASLLTGLDPPEHGVRHNGIFRLEERVPTLATQLGEAGFATGAFVGAFVLSRGHGLDRGFDHYDDQELRENSGRGIRGFAERRADAVADAALAWLQSRQEGQRSFAWLHFYDPHADYRPPPGFAAAFPRNPYAGEIAFVDRQLGRLLAGLEVDEQPGRTLVIITSDHGESLGEHGEATHSHFIYDATQRIPLLMRGPGLPAGKRVSPVVGLRDVAPTVLDLLGLPPLAGASGTSLRSVMDGGGTSAGAYLETLATQIDWRLSPLQGLRTERWKYIRAPRPELYDVIEDPGETRNRHDQEPATVRELESRLAARLADARPVEPNLEPEQADLARLRALGYVVTSPETSPTDGGELGRIGGIDPKDGIVGIRSINRADTLIQQGKPAEALELLDRVELGRGHVLHGLRASAYLAMGDASGAEQAARDAIADAPLSLSGHARLALALGLQGRIEEARASYREMLRLAPDAGGPRSGLGRLAEAAGDVEGARRWYRASLEAPHSPDPSIPWRLAALEIEAGRLAQADALLETTSQDDLGESARATLAAAECRAGRIEQARGHLAAGLAEHPNSGFLRLARACVRAAEGDLSGARDDNAEVLALVAAAADRDAPAPRTNPAHSLLRARALAGLDRRAEARDSLEATLADRHRLAPEHARDARALARELGVAPEAAEPPRTREAAGS